MAIVLNSLMSVITFIIKAFMIVIIMNFVFYKDFRQLTKKIKRVISSQQANKITQIEKLIFDYFH